MRSIRTCGNRPLEWVSLKRRHFELRCDTEPCAALAWQGVFGSTAIGETSEGTWSLKRMGFFRPYLTVREPGSETDLAVLRSERRGVARLTFSDGQTFVWRATGEAKREKGFYDDHDRLVLAARLIQKFLKLKGEMRIQPSAADCPRLSILALMAWYRLYLEHEEQAAAVVAIASAG